ncbi:MAG: DUF2029 domain-containing protein [Anaerolineales bacterium]|nr:DUF2029 domain-containing protein [Anaerolineales bacterium]
MAARTGTRVLMLVLATAVICLLTFVNYQFSAAQPGGNDFLARWTGAHYWVVEGVSPYSPEVSIAAQQMIYGREAHPEQGEDIAHFVYPLPAMLFFAPFGLLQYSTARALWMTILEIGLPLLVVISLRLLEWIPGRPMLIVLLFFSLTWYHGMRAIIVGQFAIIEALLIITALLLYSRKRDNAAGIILALTIAKPQMAVLFIPYLVLHAFAERRWRFVFSAGLSVGALILVSELLLPGWMGDWFGQLQEYPHYTAIGSPVSILTSMLPVFQKEAEVLFNALIAGGLIWIWLRSRRGGERSFIWAAMATLVVTNLIILRTATTNYVVLLPVLLYIFREWIRQNGRAGSIGVYLTMLVITIGIWWLFLTTVQGNVEGIAPYLPLPLFTLGGLLTVLDGKLDSPREQPSDN